MSGSDEIEWWGLKGSSGVGAMYFIGAFGFGACDQAARASAHDDGFLFHRNELGMWSSLAVEAGYRFDHRALLVFAEFGVDWESEDFGGGGLGDGEVAGLVA